MVDRATKQAVRHRGWALMLAIVLAVAGVITLPPTAADAAVVRNFDRVFSAQTNGEIAITGNGLLTCPTSRADCTNALTTPFATLGNNDFTMGYQDVDSDASTFASSMAGVHMPDGSRVLFAGLFWGGSLNPGPYGQKPPSSAAPNRLKLRTPDAAGYQTITADRTDLANNAGGDYSAYADVTSLVRTAGNGPYWGADVAASTGANAYGGWSLVVAYSNPSMPLRDLSVFNGFATLATNDVLPITISGFLAPKSGTVNARIGSVVYEGDAQITGDYISLNNTRLADNLSRSANFFAGRVSNHGDNLTDRSPNYVTQMAVDAKVVDAGAIVKNGDTSATVTFGTQSDGYNPAALTTQIDLYAPTIAGQKSVVNLNGNSPAKVGDILEYTSVFSNSGDDSAENSVMSDVVPAGTTYLPGSLQVTAGANAGVKSDAADADQGEFAGNKVTVRVGAGANGTTGGTLAKGASTSVRFRVRVNEDRVGATVTNTANLSFRAATIGNQFSYDTNDVVTPVAQSARLTIVKTGPSAVRAGEKITWTLKVTNAGPSTAKNVVVTDVLPDGVTGVAAPPGCTLANGTLTCTVGDLANGATWSRPVTGTVKPGSTITSLPNTASVTSDTSDPDLGDNVSTTTSDVSRLADVSMAKSVSPANPRPGETATWTLTARSAGPSTATAVRLTDTVPVGLSVVGDPDPDRGSATCTVVVRDITCDVGDLDPGESTSVRVKTRLDPAWAPASDAPADQRLVNRGYVQSTTADPDTSNNDAAATLTPAAPRADLRTKKTLVSANVRAGLPVSYRIEVTNDGPSRARDLTVTDDLPDGLDDVTATINGVACTVSSTAVTCPLDALPVGGTATVLVNGTLASSATGTLVNRAHADADTTDPDTSNNADSTSDPILTRADLAITKTATPANPNAGDDVTYTITVHNLGLSDARNVAVSDDLPAGLTLLTATSPDGTCTISGSHVACGLGTVANGDDAVVTVKTRLAANADPASITNHATVSSTTPDPNADNNVAEFTLVTGEAADLAMDKTGPATLVAGEVGTWTMSVDNHGPSRAQNVVFSDTLPDGLSDIDVTATTGGATCTVDQGTRRVRCEVASMDDGDTATATVTARLDEGYTSPARPRVVVNAASVTSDTDDPTTSNNGDVVRTATSASADLRIAKIGDGSVIAGNTVHWRLLVDNFGPSNAQDVVVDDVLPDDVTVTADDIDAPDGWTCTVTGHALHCARTGAMGAAEFGEIGISGTVAPYVASGTQLINRATIASSTPDPEDAHNSSAVQTLVTTSADLAVAKSVDPETLVAGGTANYRILVTNHGPSTALDVVVTDDLPAGLTIVSAQGPGPCTTAGQTVTCQLGTIAPDDGGQNANVVVIDVIVTADAGTEVVNRVTVDSSTPDPKLDNNEAEVSAPVTPASDLALTKTVDRDIVNAGEAARYTLTVINNGPSTATAATITDTIPAGFTVLDPPDGCTQSGAELTCAVGDLAKGESATRVLDLRVPAGADAGTVVNRATSASQSLDVDPDNNDAEVPVTVAQVANLYLRKSVLPEALVAGNPQSWRLVVGNEGPSVAHHVIVTDELPAPLQLAGPVTTPKGTCSVQGTTVTCDLGDLVREQVVIDIPTTLPSSFTGDELANTATAASDTLDADPSDNRDTVRAPVSRLADLAITKTATPSEVVAGEAVTYTLTSVNRGPSVASDVGVSDLLPPGLINPAATASGGGTCTIQPPPETPGRTPDNSGLVRCHFGDRGVGESVTVTITATVDAAATATDATRCGDNDPRLCFENTGVTGASTLDPVSDNNESVARVAVATAADLRVSKKLVGRAVAGARVHWQVSVTNAGPSVARHVVVADAVPAAATDVTTDTPGCATQGQQLTCSWESLGLGTRIVDVYGTLAPTATGTLVNDAAVTGSDTPDPDPGNDTGHTDDPIVRSADVAVTKKLIGDAVPGHEVHWQVTVTNRGPSVATDVAVSDDVPATVTGVHSDTAGCTVTGQQVRCAWPELAPGSQVVDVYGTLAADARGRLKNTAIATSGGDVDPDPGNNSGGSDTPITPEPTPTPTTPSEPGDPGDPGHHGGLPGTGSNVGLGLWAVTGLLLVGGAGLLVAGRRRRR